jgi:MFS family permease
MPRTEPSISAIVVVLAITQLIGWGTMSLPAVIGEQLARDLGLSLPAVFAGTTVTLVVSGLASPLLANVFVRYGARRVMAVGSLIAAPGFWLLAAASGPLSYYAGWIVLGIAGAAMLSTPTYILLNEIAGTGAKRKATDRRAHAGDRVVVERVLADHGGADRLARVAHGASDLQRGYDPRLFSAARIRPA